MTLKIWQEVLENLLVYWPIVPEKRHAIQIQCYPPPHALSPPILTKIRTSLISAKQGKRLLAPILFEGSTNATLFNYWLQSHLFKELAQSSTLIMDNATFHKTAATRQIIEQAGHTLLFLPPYSPDFNPIEQDFAIMKRRRQFLPADTTIDEVVRSYVYYLE